MPSVQRSALQLISDTAREPSLKDSAHFGPTVGHTGLTVGCIAISSDRSEPNGEITALHQTLVPDV